MVTIRNGESEKKIVMRNMIKGKSLISNDNQSTKKRRVDVFLIIVLAVYFIVQMTAVFSYGENYFLGDITKMNNNDDVKYVRSALNLIEKSELYYWDSEIDNDVPTAFIMPGYPVFLAFFLKLFGLKGGLLAVRLVQSLLQMGVMLLLYRIGKKYFNLWTARLAMVFYLFYIPNLGTPLLILTETIFTFLFILLVYLCFEAIETKRMTYYVWGGIVLGLAVMFRPTILLFPAVILVIWLLKKYTVQEMLKRAIVVGCILIALLAPWWIRNAVDFGRFIPLTEASGDPFMLGAFINYDQDAMKSYMKDLPPDTDAMATNKAKMELGKARLQESWQEDPLGTIHWYTLGKLYEHWRNPFYYHPQGQVLFNVSWNTVFFYHWLLLGLAGLGIVLSFLKGEANRRLKLILPLSIFYMCAVYLPYFTCSRYAYPVMPLVILLAAAGVCSAAQRLSKDYKG